MLSASYHKRMIEGNGDLLPTAGSDPGDRAPAPGSLRLVQALVNTLNAETGQDLLGTAPEAAAWLGAVGLLPPGSVLAGPQQAALLELREATRQVLSGHTHRRDDPAAASRLTMALAPCRLTLAVDPAGGARLVSADTTRSAGSSAASPRRSPRLPRPAPGPASSAALAGDAAGRSTTGPPPAGHAGAPCRSAVRAPRCARTGTGRPLT